MRSFRLTRLTLLAGAVTGLAAMAVAGGKPAEVAELDKPITPFKLRDVTKDLKEHEKEDAALVDVAQYKGKKNVVLFWMSEQCGTTWKYEKRVGEMLKANAKNDVVFFALRSSLNDTPESIRKYAESKHFDMPVLDDPHSKVAKYFKARTTPSFAVSSSPALRSAGLSAPVAAGPRPGAGLPGWSLSRSPGEPPAASRRRPTP